MKSHWSLKFTLLLFLFLNNPTFAATQSGFFEQQLDHFSKHTATFKQRYHVNSDYAEGANAPVLFYMCGEWNCDAQELGGVVAEFAKKLKAHRVALEHRFYGKSIPFKNLTTQNLKHLRVEQALKDLESFQKQAIKRFSLKGPWITLGYSYGGTLAAFYRLLFPSRVVGAFASSAPLLAKTDFWEFDAKVAIVAGDACRIKTQAGIRAVDELIQDPSKYAFLQKEFRGEKISNPKDFLVALADIAGIAIPFGDKELFCDTIASFSDPLQGYAAATRAYLKKLGPKYELANFSLQGASVEDITHPKAHPQLRAWMYQSCSQFGFFQTKNPDSLKALRSQFVTPEYYADVCKKLFGFKQPPFTKRMNQLFYKRFFTAQASKMYFSNGANDPWAILSISKDAKNTQTNPMLDSFNIREAGHGDDFNPNIQTPGVLLSRNRFVFLANEWIRY